ncbi:uncharacterized protein LOC141905782 [Tubulanus polymorphus]|uniref:uncharacterized protein LOC141905782 n=1 Tax=Tubulanus polymorphus TaxID=672921 RepID=UPI003DA69A44
MATEASRHPTLDEVKDRKDLFHDAIIRFFFTKYSSLINATKISILDFPPTRNRIGIGSARNRLKKSNSLRGRPASAPASYAPPQSGTQSESGSPPMPRKQTAKSKLSRIGMRDLKSVIQEVATELAIVYEYQVVMIANVSDVDTLAEYVVDCMFNSLKKPDVNFCRNDMFHAVMEANARVKKKYVSTRLKTTSWNVSKIFKCPGLRLEEPGSSEETKYKFYQCFSPYGHACKPHKYGFRNPMYDWNDRRRCFELIFQDQATYHHRVNAEIPFSFQNVHQLYRPYHIFIDSYDLLSYINNNHHGPNNDFQKSFTDFVRVSHGFKGDMKVVYRPTQLMIGQLYLDYADFSKCDFSRIVMSHMAEKLTRVSFRGTNLTHADFAGLSMSNCDFSNANLTFCNMEHVHFGSNVKFEGAILTHVIAANAHGPHGLIMRDEDSTISETGFLELADTSGALVHVRNKLLQQFESSIRSLTVMARVDSFEDLLMRKPMSLVRILTILGPSQRIGGSQLVVQSREVCPEDVFHGVGRSGRIAVRSECDLFAKVFTHFLLHQWVCGMTRVSNGGLLNHAFEYDDTDHCQRFASDFTLAFVVRTNDIVAANATIADCVVSKLTNCDRVVSNDNVLRTFVEQYLQQDNVLLIVDDSDCDKQRHLQDDDDDGDAVDRDYYLDELNRLGCSIVFVTGASRIGFVSQKIKSEVAYKLIERCE